MPPRDFSQDGAIGAGGGGDTGGAIGPQIMHDPGPSASSTPSSSQPSVSSYFGARGASPGGSAMIGAPQRSSAPPPSAGAIDTGGGLPTAAGFPQPTLWGIQNNPMGLSFSTGGAVSEDTDGSPEQDSISRALDTVDGVLAFGRKQHGLGGGQQMAMNTDGFSKSNNIEDRRDNDPTQGQPDQGNGQSNFDRVANKVNDVRAGMNPTSKAMGINDLPPLPMPYPGDGGGSNSGAIQMSDEENE